jgi:hypothetical protein
MGVFLCPLSPLPLRALFHGMGIVGNSIFFFLPLMTRNEDGLRGY